MVKEERRAAKAIPSAFNARNRQWCSPWRDSSSPSRRKTWWRSGSFARINGATVFHRLLHAANVSATITLKRQAALRLSRLAAAARRRKVETEEKAEGGGIAVTFIRPRRHARNARSASAWRRLLRRATYLFAAHAVLGIFPAAAQWKLGMARRRRRANILCCLRLAWAGRLNRTYQHHRLPGASGWCVTAMGGALSALRRQTGVKSPS